MMRSPFIRFALAAGLLAMLCVLAPAQVAQACSFNGEQVNYFPADHQPYHHFPVPQYMGWLGAFDYDSHQRVMAFATAPQQVVILYTLPIDLSEQLDGAIVDIEWLPSLFYDAPE